MVECKDEKEFIPELLRMALHSGDFKFEINLNKKQKEMSPLCSHCQRVGLHRVMGVAFTSHSSPSNTNASHLIPWIG
ncbi:Polyhomeotic-like protein [Dirofilaria immitis]